MPGCLQRVTLCVCRPADPIPIPVVERVASPWALAEQGPTQSPASQPDGTAGKPEASGRASLGRPKAGGRRSLLGVSNMRSIGGSGATPSSAVRPPPGGEGKLPTPWSTLRPWDGKAAAHEAAAAAASGDENQGGSCEPQQQQQPQQAGPGVGPGPQQEEAQLSGDRLPQQQRAAPPAGSTGPGPTHGCIALTSVDAAVVDLARSATRRLRGLRVCPEGREEGQVTHLVIGGERRTLKLMLAVANGAWLLSPQWVTASLEAGRWLPESQFPAKVGWVGCRWGYL